MVRPTQVLLHSDGWVPAWQFMPSPPPALPACRILTGDMGMIGSGCVLPIGAA